MRKLAFCICENKDADQLRGNREADQRLCFRYTDSKILLLSKSEISSLKASSVAVQPGLCQTWSETPKTGFLRTRLIFLMTRLTYKVTKCDLRYIIFSWIVYKGIQDVFISQILLQRVDKTAKLFCEML